jgi:hypothetical protein
MDAEIAEKGHFWMETSLPFSPRRRLPSDVYGGRGFSPEIESLGAFCPQGKVEKGDER